MCLCTCVCVFFPLGHTYVHAYCVSVEMGNNSICVLRMPLIVGPSFQWILQRLCYLVALSKQCQRTHNTFLSHWPCACRKFLTFLCSVVSPTPIGWFRCVLCKYLFGCCVVAEPKCLCLREGSTCQFVVLLFHQLGQFNRADWNVYTKMLALWWYACVCVCVCWIRSAVMNGYYFQSVGVCVCVCARVCIHLLA
jgi:hypothetical protein